MFYVIDGRAMTETKKTLSERFRLIAAFLVVGIISLIQPGCNCSSSNDGTAPPATITTVLPASSSATALVATDVIAVFSIDMDVTSVTTAFILSINNSPVPANVTYVVTTKTATLSPAADLAPNTEYRATIASSVKDIDGNSPLSTDFIWSFKTSPVMLLTSKNFNSVTSNNVSRNSDIDSSGRYIVFESEATNLASVATTLNRQHIYLKDTVTGEVLLVSSDSSGLVEANNQAGNPRISSNGRYVVFESAADNLDGNSNSNNQIYLKDLSNNAVSLISRDTSGIPDNGAGGASNASVSNDGRYVLFQSSDREMSAIDGGGIAHVYLKDMSNGTIVMISRTATGFAGDAASNNPDMSADGKHIVFESLAANFTASNSFNHIYYVDATAATHSVEQISVATAGAEATANCNNPSISDDGAMVVYDTVAILDGFDTNGTTDIYFRYRPSQFTKLVSANPGTSDSGNGSSSNADISGDANYVVFESLASDLVTEGSLGVKDIFVRDLSALPATVIDRVNNPESGGEATSDSDKPAISKDGRYVSFHSFAPYTLDDTDTLFDVFRAHNSTYP